MRRWLVYLATSAVVPVGTAAAFEWSEHDRGTEPIRDESTTRLCRFDRELDVTSFMKGNLHAHSELSDGDSPPEEVIAWYRRHGYSFLALTDHNRFADPQRYAWLEDDGFRLVGGEEVSMVGGTKQVHVNALCTTRRIGGGTFASPSEALVWAIREIEGQGGVALVNHPNFDAALDAEDLVAAHRAPLLEIMSGHPYVYSEGTARRPSGEQLWDQVLSDRVGFMGVAVDDVHHLRVSAEPPAFPGRAWVEVFANRNDPDALCAGLRQGLLYSSTGPSLRRIRVTARSYTVWPAAPCQVFFIGDGGRVLDSTLADRGEPASYTLHGSEAYVRVTLRALDGGMAWTPPVFVTGSGF